MTAPTEPSSNGSRVASASSSGKGSTPSGVDDESPEHGWGDIGADESDPSLVKGQSDASCAHADLETGCSTGEFDGEEVRQRLSDIVGQPSRGVVVPGSAIEGHPTHVRDATPATPGRLAMRVAKARCAAVPMASTRCRVGCSVWRRRAWGPSCNARSLKEAGQVLGTSTARFTRRWFALGATGNPSVLMALWTPVDCAIARPSLVGPVRQTVAVWHRKLPSTSVPDDRVVAVDASPPLCRLRWQRSLWPASTGSPG
jgi:hypothetical protein